MSLEVFGVLLAGFLTLCIFSFLYKDNPFYRFAEHLYVGVSTGYLCCRYGNDVFSKKLYQPLFDPAPGSSSDLLLIIPLVLGIFMVLKLVPSVNWLSRWAIAFVVGGTIGLSITNRFKSDVMLQVKGTIKSFQAKEKTPDEAWHLFNVYRSRYEDNQYQGDYAAFTRVNLGYQQIDAALAYLRVEAKSDQEELFLEGSERMARMQKLSGLMGILFENLKQNYRTSLTEIPQLLLTYRQLKPVVESELKTKEAELSNFVFDSKTEGHYDKAVEDSLFHFNTKYSQLNKMVAQLQAGALFIQDALAEISQKLENLESTPVAWPHFKTQEEMLLFVNAMKADLLRHKEVYDKLVTVYATFDTAWEELKEVGINLEQYRHLQTALEHLEKAQSIVEETSSSDNLTAQSIQVSRTSLDKEVKELRKEAGVLAKGMEKLHVKGFVPDYQIVVKKFSKRWELFSREDMKKPLPSETGDFLKAFFIAASVLTILVYFFFSTEHKGGVGIAARAGIYFLMLSFGASFGYTIMARISLLIGRMQFLIKDCTDAISALF